MESVAAADHEGEGQKLLDELGERGDRVILRTVCLALLVGLNNLVGVDVDIEPECAAAYDVVAEAACRAGVVDVGAVVDVVGLAALHAEARCSAAVVERQIQPAAIRSEAPRYEQSPASPMGYPEEVF